MDDYLNRLKQKIDSMNEEELMYILVPELMFVRDEMQIDGDVKKIKQIDEALEYIKQRVDFTFFYQNILEENIPIEQFKRRKNKPQSNFPTPNEIINGISPKNIPNN